MIAPQELRLGNWISINGNPFQLELPDFNLIVHKNGKSTYEPIELTEDWLLKLGFKRAHDQKYYHEKCDRTWVEMTSILVKQFGNAGGGIKVFDYVHQLQNVFFIITGEELTIKEQK